MKALSCSYTDRPCHCLVTGQTSAICDADVTMATVLMYILVAFIQDVTNSDQSVIYHRYMCGIVWLCT